MAALGKLGRIESKDITSADVTADLLATEAEVEARRGAQAKASQLAGQAASPADRSQRAEAAQQQQAALAAAQARLQQLSSQRLWATLTLRFHQPLPPPSPGSRNQTSCPAFWKPSTSAGRLC